MITSVEVSDFMGIDKECYTLVHRHPAGTCSAARRIQITGSKGSGKTRFLRALAFAFTGRHLDGMTRPHTLISEGCREASVRVRGTHGFELVKSIDRTRRTVRTRMISHGTLVTEDTQDYHKLVGCSPDRLLSASIPGYFMRLDPAKRLRVYNEHTAGARTLTLEDFAFRPMFRASLIGPRGTLYDNFCNSDKWLADMRICKELQGYLDTSVQTNKFLLMDDARLNEHADVEFGNDVQMFIAKEVSGTNFKILV